MAMRVRASWFVCALWALCAGGAHAQSSTGSMPGTLRGGSPESRLPDGASARPRAQRERTQPGPAITLDRRQRGAAANAERRSLQLLEREIRLLRRLVGNMGRSDPRRPGVLLRLSQAYQEKIWALKVRAHALREQAHGGCPCRRAEAAGQVQRLAEAAGKSGNVYDCSLTDSG